MTAAEKIIKDNKLRIEAISEEMRRRMDSENEKDWSIKEMNVLVSERCVRRAVRLTKGNIMEAAFLVGLSKKQMYILLKEMDLPDLVRALRTISGCRTYQRSKTCWNDLSV